MGEKLKAGKTLIGSVRGNENGTEFRVFYGNYILPVIGKKFRHLSQEDYASILGEFLASEEGKKYIQPTKEEILAASSFVLEKENEYIKNELKKINDKADVKVNVPLGINESKVTEEVKPVDREKEKTNSKFPQSEDKEETANSVSIDLSMLMPASGMLMPKYPEEKGIEDQEIKKDDEVSKEKQRQEENAFKEKEHRPEVNLATQLISGIMITPGIMIEGEEDKTAEEVRQKEKIQGEKAEACLGEEIKEEVPPKTLTVTPPKVASADIKEGPTSAEKNEAPLEAAEKAAEEKTEIKAGFTETVPIKEGSENELDKEGGKILRLQGKSKEIMLSKKGKPSEVMQIDACADSAVQGPVITYGSEKRNGYTVLSEKNLGKIRSDNEFVISNILSLPEEFLDSEIPDLIFDEPKEEDEGRSHEKSHPIRIILLLIALFIALTAMYSFGTGIKPVEVSSTEYIKIYLEGLKDLFAKAVNLIKKPF